MNLSRRRLLTAVPHLAVSATATTSCAGRPNSTTQPGSAAAVTRELAGMTLKELRALYQGALEEDLGFWDRNGIDQEYGGFMCTMDHDGTILSTEKSVTFQGRGVWVYSFLYDNFGRDPRHLEIARKAKTFLIEHARHADGTWAQEVSREGKINTPFNGTVYDGLYVALGLQEYARATGDTQALDLASATFLKCMEIYDRADYGVAAAGSRHPPGSRIQGVEMVLVDLLPQMLEQVSDHPRLKEYQDRTFGVLMEKFFNPEFQLNNEILKHDYVCYEDPHWRYYVELGFSIASFWSLLFEAKRRKDDGLFRTAAHRLRRHMEVAWDDVYGGFGTTTQVDRGCVNYGKVSYVHEEAMLGCLCVIEHLGESWAKEWYDRIHHFAFEKFPVRNHPGWHSYMDRKCTPQPHVRRRENFHHPRYLMHSLLILDRLIQRGGRPAGVRV